MKDSFPLWLVVSFIICISSCKEQSEPAKCGSCDGEVLEVLDSGVYSVQGVKPLRLIGKEELVACDTAFENNLEVGKRVVIQGQILESCVDTFSYRRIRIDNLSVIDFCLPPIDTLANAQFEIFGKWNLFGIKNEQMIYPPCEAGQPFIEIFYSDGVLMINAFLGDNSCLGQLSIDGQTMLISTDKICTLSLPQTEALREFESLFGSFLYCHEEQCSLTYAIEENFLTLEKADGLTATFFAY